MIAFRAALLILVAAAVSCSSSQTAGPVAPVAEITREYRAATYSTPNFIDNVPLEQYPRVLSAEPIIVPTVNLSVASIDRSSPQISAMLQVAKIMYQQGVPATEIASLVLSSLQPGDAAYILAEVGIKPEDLRGLTP